jgi:hypothetical protein
MNAITLLYTFPDIYNQDTPLLEYLHASKNPYAVLKEKGMDACSNYNKPLDLKYCGEYHILHEFKRICYYTK